MCAIFQVVLLSSALIPALLPLSLVFFFFQQGTSPETAAIAYEVGLKQGKTPIVVKDVPGFFVNRCLGPYSDEGLAVLLDGASITQVDKVCRRGRNCEK